MKIKHNGKDYELDVEDAIRKGYLVDVTPKTIELSQDEAAVLYMIMGRIGGNPKNARGCTNSVRAKIWEAFEGNLKSKYNLSMEAPAGPLYFLD